MSRRQKKRYSDFSNVNEESKSDIPEEFPDGAFGAPGHSDLNTESPKIKNDKKKWE